MARHGTREREALVPNPGVCGKLVRLKWLLTGNGIGDRAGLLDFGMVGVEIIRMGDGAGLFGLGMKRGDPDVAVVGMV